MQKKIKKITLPAIKETFMKYGFQKYQAELEKKIMQEGTSIVDRAIHMAHLGSEGAVKMLMDKMLPNKKERYVEIQIGKLETLDDIKKAEENIMRQVFDGNITYVEGNGLMDMINNYKTTMVSTTYSDILDNVTDANNVIKDIPNIKEGNS